jgi:hypothetical protein
MGTVVKDLWGRERREGPHDSTSQEVVTGEGGPHFMLREFVCSQDCGPCSCRNKGEFEDIWAATGRVGFQLVVWSRQNKLSLAVGEPSMAENRKEAAPALPTPLLSPLCL